jgi:plasmid stabilization system protein ParE
MIRDVVILNAAKADFREIKKHVKKQFGDFVWAEVNNEFKNTIHLISNNPKLGSVIEELGVFGYENYREILVRQTRVVYEFSQEQLIVHMFINTKRDFKNHLEMRLLAS